MAFFEFEIATTGLFAAQRGLSVTSNNITNATTPGYSRQILGQRAGIPLTGIGVGMTGTGVTTTDIKRVRDSYLDAKLWSQSSKLGEYRIKVEQNSIIETVYGEPSDAGFTKVFSDLFTAFDKVSTLPDEGERKTGLRQQMISFTEYFKNISSSLSKFQNDLNFELKSKVDEINLLGSKIQNLNSQIFQAELFGNDANTFRDERDALVDRLSQLVDVQTREDDYVAGNGNTYKKFSVKVAGQTLVDHQFLRQLDIKVRATKFNEEDAEGLYDVIWRDGAKFDMSDSRMSGELKGVIDMRDGCGTGEAVSYNGIPYYIKRMDEYVRTFAETMNEIYSKNAEGLVVLKNTTTPTATTPAEIFMTRDASGNPDYYFLDGSGTKVTVTAADAQTYQPKYQLFTYTNGTNTGQPVANPDLSHKYVKMTSANFSISKEIYDSASNFRTNYQHYTDTTPAANPKPGLGDLMLALSAQKNNKKMFKEGNPKDYMIAVFSELGINAQEAKMYETTQTSITNNIINQRLSISQVDNNEEFTNLIKYQQAYQAAAKIINTIDSIYETTIFKLGNF